MTKTNTMAAGDLYLEYVRRFPLRRLKNGAEHAEALRVFAQVSLRHQGARDNGAIDYLDMLAHLIDQYERTAHLKLDLGRRTPADLIRHLMRAGGLSVAGLARELGIAQSNLSEMLSGRRDFSKVAIGKLCERFGISPSIFFPSRAAGAA